MVARLLAGEKARAIARSTGCSPTTVTTARDRWLAATEAERAGGAWCAPRRPLPRSCPWALSADEEQAILTAREKTNWGPMQLSAITGRHRSTNYKVLKRHGVSRRRRSTERQTTRRYEWAEAGTLLHIDAFSVAKFDQPGHWATGNRSQAERSRDVGKTVVIGVIDDHTRLAYCELHSAEKPSPSRRVCAAPPRGCASRAAAPRGGHERQRQVLRHQPRVRRHARRARCATHPHPALHATLERQDRALFRHPRHRVGPQPRVAELDGP